MSSQPFDPSKLSNPGYSSIVINGYNQNLSIGENYEYEVFNYYNGIPTSESHAIYTEVGGGPFAFQQSIYVGYYDIHGRDLYASYRDVYDNTGDYGYHYGGSLASYYSTGNVAFPTSGFSLRLPDGDSFAVDEDGHYLGDANGKIDINDGFGSYVIVSGFIPKQVVLNHADGSKSVDQYSGAFSDLALQHRDYDAHGKVSHEARYNANSDLTYEVTNNNDGTSFHFLKQGTESHYSTFEADGSLAIKDIVNEDGTHDLTDLYGGDVVEGSAGNDTFWFQHRTISGVQGPGSTIEFGEDFGNDTIRGFVSLTQAGGNQHHDTLSFAGADLSEVTITYSGKYQQDTVVHVGDHGTVTLLANHVKSVSDLGILIA